MRYVKFYITPYSLTRVIDVVMPKINDNIFDNEFYTVKKMSTYINVGIKWI